MRILQVTPTFMPSNFGGISLFYNLSKNLTKRGHEVVVYTTDIKDRYSRLAEIQGGRNIDGIKVWYYRNISNTLATKYRLSVPRGMSLAIRRKINSFDIIHLHNFRTFQNILIHHYAKKYDIPYVLQAHGSLTTFFHKRWLKRIFDVIWGRRILKDVSKVFALTPIEAEQYKNMGVSEHKIEIVPNGLDLSEFDNLPERGEFRTKYGLDANQKIILFLGRIHRIKGLDLLIKVFSDLAKFLDDVKLVIAGPDDGYLTSLKKLVADSEISEKVLFTGPLYGQEKLKAYVDADVYILPSFYETFPMTLLEAMACGTPVIVTDRCGIADVINGQAGLVVPYDKDQLRDALLHMLSDDQMRLRFGEKGKLLVREKFNWEKIAEQVEGVYRGVQHG
ncbi:Alpha-monoglucosyldiacylglycerol synthase [subsurface metagenome]